MKTLVINLDRAPERLAHMAEVFARHGLTFERVAAVDGEALTDEEVAARRQGEPRFYELGKKEVACFLSHRRCWEIAAKSVDSHTIICEDDIFLGDSAQRIFSNAAWIPEDADIVKLESFKHRSLLSKHCFATIDDRGLYRLYHDYEAAGAYVVSRGFAQFLLAKSETFRDPVDQFLFNTYLDNPTSGMIYQLAPAVAIQEFFLKRPSSQSLGSALRHERRSKRRRGWAKIGREIIRPFEQMAGSLNALATGLFTDRRWCRVRFR